MTACPAVWRRRVAPRPLPAARSRLPGQPDRRTPTSLPFFLVFAAFSVYPWLDTAWVSLHDTRLSTYDQSSWIGLENYRNLFTNQFFWNAFRNTITIGIISTVPQLCMALGHRPPAQLPAARRGRSSGSPS